MSDGLRTADATRVQPDPNLTEDGLHTCPGGAAENLNAFWDTCAACMARYRRVRMTPELRRNDASKIEIRDEWVKAVSEPMAIDEIDVPPVGRPRRPEAQAEIAPGDDSLRAEVIAAIPLLERHYDGTIREAIVRRFRAALRRERAETNGGRDGAQAHAVQVRGGTASGDVSHAGSDSLCDRDGVGVQGERTGRDPVAGGAPSERVPEDGGGHHPEEQAAQAVGSARNAGYVGDTCLSCGGSRSKGPRQDHSACDKALASEAKREDTSNASPTTKPCPMCGTLRSCASCKETPTPSVTGCEHGIPASACRKCAGLSSSVADLAACIEGIQHEIDEGDADGGYDIGAIMMWLDKARAALKGGVTR